MIGEWSLLDAWRVAWETPTCLPGHSVQRGLADLFSKGSDNKNPRLRAAVDGP